MDFILIFVLVFFVIIILTFILTFLKIRKNVREFSKTVFGNVNMFEGIKQQKLELANDPKSVASMEKLILPRLAKDFPNLNINEMKKMAENSILLCLTAIENKKIENFDFASEKIVNWVNSKINDLANDKTVNYDSIKFHRTVLNRYVKEAGICSIVFQTSVEYLYRQDNKDYEKIQDRFNTEFIYIFDDLKIDKSQHGIALNCPNCGAPIKNLGVKICSYCGTGVIDLVKKTWILNDISQF